MSAKAPPAKPSQRPRPRQRRIGSGWGAPPVAYPDDLDALRAKIDEAERSLDAGAGKETDVNEFLARLSEAEA